MTGNGNGFKDSTALTPVNPIVGRSVAQTTISPRCRERFSARIG